MEEQNANTETLLKSNCACREREKSQEDERVISEGIVEETQKWVSQLSLTRARDIVSMDRIFVSFRPSFELSTDWNHMSFDLCSATITVKGVVEGMLSAQQRQMAVAGKTIASARMSIQSSSEEDFVLSLSLSPSQWLDLLNSNSV